MSDSCPIITIVVDIQENGIIRLEDGRLIGRLSDNTSFDEIKSRFTEESLQSLYTTKGSKCTTTKS